MIASFAQNSSRCIPKLETESETKILSEQCDLKKIMKTHTNDINILNISSHT